LDGPRRRQRSEGEGTTALDSEKLLEGRTLTSRLERSHGGPGPSCPCERDGPGGYRV
jgi:hypothetical protein